MALPLALGSVIALGQVTPASHSINVRVNNDYPPYEFEDASGNATGFDADVVRASAKAVNMNVIVESGKWSDIKDDLSRGKVDLLAGMLYSKDRSREFELGAPYLAIEYSIFVRKGSSIETPADLRKASVLVEDGSQMHEQLKKDTVGRIIPAPSEPEAVRMLAAGEGDAAIVPLLEGLMVIQDGHLKEVAPVGIPVYTRNLCFAARKGNTELIARLNNGLAIIRSDGKYDTIYQKWFGPLTPLTPSWTTVLRYFLGAIGVVAVLLALGFVWLVTLRRQVFQRTRALNNELVERMRVQGELRMSEEKYRDLIEQASDGIISINDDHIILSANSAFCSLLGLERSAVVGLPVNKLFAPNELDRFEEAVQQMESGRRILTDRRFYHTSGRLIETEISARQIAPGLFQAIVRDVTLRKNAERELKQVNEALEERVAERTAALQAAFDELETFSYSVSHDLRGPLRAMSGYASIIKQDYGESLPEEMADYLDRISANASKMDGLINDLLKYARMGRATFHSQEVDLEKLAEEVWATLSEQRKDHGVVLKIKPLPKAQGDPTMLHMLLTNLLDNAIKFSQGCPTPAIEIGFDEDQCAYYVRDNGVGFDPQYAKKLFGVFERLHTSEFEGSGVGLAIVKRVAEKHSGRVWAESGVGKGSTFWFTLSPERRKKASASA